MAKSTAARCAAPRKILADALARAGFPNTPVVRGTARIGHVHIHVTDNMFAVAFVGMTPLAKYEFADVAVEHARYLSDEQWAWISDLARRVGYLFNFRRDHFLLDPKTDDQFERRYVRGDLRRARRVRVGLHPEGAWLRIASRTWMFDGDMNDPDTRAALYSTLGAFVAEWVA